MIMSNSHFVSYTQLSPHKRDRNGNRISKITIHHAAVVNASLQGLGNGFSGSRVASSNYGIDSDGNVGMYVEEEYRAITSSDTENDEMAVTIEVANSKGSPNWEVSDQALAALIELCVDICRRNSIEKLNYTGDKSGNLTRHNMFAATTCPGPYLQEKFPYIAEEVNRHLSGDKKGDYRMELRNLQKGCVGEDVRALQILLIGRGYNCGSTGADGDFGSKTDTAVREYQRAKGLEVDGIAGRNTMGTLLGAVYN